MIVTEEIIKVKGQSVRAMLQRFDSNDLKKLGSIFKTWQVLQKKQAVYGRKSNIPEVITEGVVAYFLGCPILGKFPDDSSIKQVNYTKAQLDLRRKKREAGVKTKDRPKLPSGSFDCYDLDAQKMVQVKSASVDPDLTSFGPRSEFQKLYFLDFSSKDKVNGEFVIYDMPVARVKSILKKAKEKNKAVRPRFSLQEKILKGKKRKYQIGRKRNIFKSI
jgi:hypothetical protein